MEEEKKKEGVRKEKIVLKCIDEKEVELTEEEALFSPTIQSSLAEKESKVINLPVKAEVLEKVKSYLQAMLNSQENNPRQRTGTLRTPEVPKFWKEELFQLEEDVLWE